MIKDKRLPLKEKFVEFLGRNPFYKHACWFVGISEMTLSRWRKEDEDFDKKCESMRAQTLTKYVNRSSTDFILTHADPETFSKTQKIELTVVQPLVIEKSHDNKTVPVADESTG